MKEIFGKKADNLKKLHTAGFNVPPFMVLSQEECEASLKDSTVLKERLNGFTCKTFAIRSSTSGEDSLTSSRAGQYHTEIRVPKSGIEKAIGKCIDHSTKRMLKGETLSIIIQEYIEAEYSGVCFTRDPEGKRESILEYHKGIGAEIVGGEILPTSIRWYRNEKPTKLPDGVEIDIFFQIESMFGCPEDIEWCTKDGIMYILQSRPITTLSQASGRSLNFLEQQIPARGRYLFEKNEITEVAPSPTPFTYSLLEKIFENEGPVWKTYRKYHIHYNNTSSLRRIGNSLYSDKEKEIQSLFPAGRLNSHYHFSIGSFYGIWRSLWNFIAFTLLSIQAPPIQSLQKELFTRIKTPPKRHSFGESLQMFLEDYKYIFEINLFTTLSYKKLQTLLKKEIDIGSALTLVGLFPGYERYALDISSLSLRGNSLEITDTGDFQSFAEKYPPISEGTQKWWESLSLTKKKYLEKEIRQTEILTRFREYGRILMVKNMEQIRLSLKNEGYQLSDIAFVTIDEILTQLPEKGIREERKKHFLKWSQHSFPSEIRDSYFRSEEQIYNPISTGIAGGILCDRGDIRKMKGKKILFSENLSPDLAEYFGEIDGIVSLHGGTLSHLAILAREYSIPVIILKERPNEFFGKFVEIDGGSGKIYTP